MARRHRPLLQLPALAAASVLLILASPLHATPAFPVDLSASTDASAPAVSHGAPRAAAVAGYHRLLTDVPAAYAEADDPAPSSSVHDDVPAATASSSSKDADPAPGASSSPLKALRGALGLAFFPVAVLFLLCALGVFFLALKVAALAAAYVAGRCAAAWRSVAAAREKATRVEAAAGA